MRMRRKITINLGLFITGAMIFWIILNIKSYQYEISLIEKISNSMITSNSVYFQTQGECIELDKIYEFLPEQGILYNYLSWDKNQKGILLKNNIPNVPILNGRFFNKNDIKEKVAVVGKNIMSGLDDKKIINVNGENYKVIGVMGVDYDTRLDDEVWLILNEENINAEGTFILDGLNEKAILSYLGLSNIWSEVLILDRENIGILEAIDRENDYWIFPMMIIWVGWSYSLILLYQWLNIHMNEINLRKELGYTFRGILRILIQKSFMPYAMGMLLVLGISIVTKSNQIDIGIRSIFFGIILFILLWVSILIYCKVKNAGVYKD